MTTYRRKTLASELADAEFGLKQDLVNSRVRADISQADAATRMGICEDEVMALERLDSNPTLSQLRYYAEAIGVRIRFVVERVANSSPSCGR